MTVERITLGDKVDAFVTNAPGQAGIDEGMRLHGTYHAVLRDKDGNVKWEESFPNLVTTVGKNHALDNELAGSSYSVTGPYMGLISSTSYTGVNAADTMASHSGWLEAGNANTPHYSGTRKTITFSAASGGSKASSSTNTYSFTGSGTVKGAFLVLGSGAVNTIDDTNGTLYSAGLFSGGDKTVANGDTLTVSYTAGA